MSSLDENQFVEKMTLCALENYFRERWRLKEIDKRIATI